MRRDALVEEGRKAGREYIASFKGDWDALREDLNRRSREEGRKLVDRSAYVKRRRKSSSLKFPLLKGDCDDDYPGTLNCPVCRRKMGGDAGYVSISVGAILHDNIRRRSGGPDKLMSGFWDVTFKGRTNPKDASYPYVTLPVVHDVYGGQARIIVCSTLCLAEFFRVVVTGLESAIARDAKPAKQPKRKASSKQK